MKKTLINLVSVLGLGVITIVTGCAKDQNAIEYHQAQVNKQIALFQSISGPYRGLLMNQADGSSMGAIEVVLTPQISVINSGDNTSTAPQAGLIGKVTIYNNGQSEAVIKNASFVSPDNTSNGNLVGTITVTLTNLTTVNLSINGNVLGNTLTGMITTTDKVGITGQFSAVRNASLATVLQNLPPQTTGVQAGDVVKYVSSPQTASTTDSADALQAQMSIRNIGNTAAENFANTFSLQRIVSIQVLLAPGIDGAAFNSAEMDLQNGVIHAQATNQGTVGAQVSLDCNKVVRNNTPAWSCTYTSNFSGGSQNFTVAAVKVN